jgi:molybdopterin synthase sulfur carrier subunit
MINVLFFAHIQDAIGKESLIIDVGQLTIRELKKKLALEYHLPHLNNIMFAINEEYASDDDNIQSGDVVALIPPVSGG